MYIIIFVPLQEPSEELRGLQTQGMPEDNRSHSLHLHVEKT
jgi:hypothetical protein